MPEIFDNSLNREKQEERLEPRGEAKRMAALTVFIVIVALLALLFLIKAHAQSKYSLISPGGIAFSDFKGYEDWPFVSSAKDDSVLKVIVANPAMINAFKAGVPAGGKIFPDGSMIVKLQWKPKKSAEAQFPVDVPDVFTQAFVMEKDSRRFSHTGGWGYAVFNYDAANHTFTPDAKSLSDCGNACHQAVKARDYIFHPYEVR